MKKEPKNNSIEDEDEDDKVDFDAQSAVQELDGYRDWVKEQRCSGESLGYGDW